MPKPLAPDAGGFVALIAALMTMTAMTIDINLPAVPAIAAALQTSLTAAQLTITGFFLGFAAGQAVWGPVSDRFGRRPVMLTGIAVYLTATLGCALSGSIETLVLARVVEGFGAGAGPVLGRAIVRDLFRGAEMARVMSLIMAAFVTAPIIAPSIGALLLGVTGWRGIFVFLAAYGVVLLLIVATRLGESLAVPDPAALRPGRLASAYASIFRHPDSRRPALVMILAYATLIIFLTNAPAIFMVGHGLSPAALGAIFAVIGVCSAMGSLLNARLARALPLAAIVRGALFAGMATTLLLAVSASTGWGGYALLVLGWGGFFICFGLIVSNVMTLALAPHGQIIGAAAAALGTAHTLIPAVIASAVASLGSGTAVPAALASLLLLGLSALIFMRGGPHAAAGT